LGVASLDRIDAALFRSFVIRTHALPQVILAREPVDGLAWFKSSG
jgi:hypothetical protein